MTDNLTSYGVAAGELTQFIERLEALEQEKKDVGEQIKEVFSELKGRGYDVKVVRKVIAVRKRDAEDIAEEDAVFDMYKAALGMGGMTAALIRKIQVGCKQLGGSTGTPAIRCSCLWLVRPA